VYYDPDNANISTSTFTWSYCDIPGWSGIREELALLPPKVVRPKTSFWRTSEIGLYEPHLPCLWAWFRDSGLEVRSVAWVHSLPNSRAQIHTDLGPSDLALQLPVTGCEDTYTAIYWALAPAVLKLTTPVGYYWQQEQVQERDRYWLRDRPILLNIKHPHQVVNTGRLHRQAISVRFAQDPWWLVDN